MRWLVPLILLAFVLPLALLPAQDGLPPAAPLAPNADHNRPQLAKRDWTVKGVLYTAADAQRAAALDLKQLAQTKSSAELYYYRYLADYNFPEDMRSDVYSCAAFLLNSLSSEADIVRPARGGPGKILIRVNLFDYGIDPKVWDTAFKNDPYFTQSIDKHIIPADALDELRAEAEIEEQAPAPAPEVKLPATLVVHTRSSARVYIDGEPLAVSNQDVRRLNTPPLSNRNRFFYTVRAEWLLAGGSTVVSQKTVWFSGGEEVTVDLTRAGSSNDPDPRGKPDVVVLKPKPQAKADSPNRHKVATLTGPAGWLDVEASKYLVATLQSEAPITRTDFFITKASLPPVYYNLLGLKTLDDFKNLVGFDWRADRIKQTRATVVKSGSGGLATPVAYNNRALARTPTFNGAMWQTFDFLTSVKENNVIRNFAVNRRDAAEWIGNGPNGLQFYFLTNEQDKRVDEGAIAVVHDSIAKDGRVLNGRSCIWCHSTGIHPFRSQFQLQVGARMDQSDLGIFDHDPIRQLMVIRDLRRTFSSPNFDEVVKIDCEAYTKAVAAANGLTAEGNASLFRQLWVGYQETDVDIARACYEVGLKEDELKAIIPLKKDGQDDPVLLQLMLRPPVSIRREQWEEAFPEIMLRAVTFRLAHPQVALPAPPP